MRGTVKPIEWNLIDRFAVVVKMERRIEMRPLVRRQADLRDVVADGRDCVVHDHANLGIPREIRLAVFERV